MNMRPLYAALAIVGTVAPYTVFLPWLVENGIAPDLFLSAMFETNISSFFSLDVLISALVLVIATIVSKGLSSGKKAGIIVATCLIGVSSGLPLYLYLTASKER
ncbi:DUF2834 domain-containing protein [Rhodospirillaceae bacterium KN72]|uniref:DUF2834 domain-containing protein n=1 Tax=Pacificispira spongiicola TaxID=2729598 RepID=A0A7Y0HIA6_9PROT|nr:DUF2834 domain-containing protein [Pacificispira spongiicola]NMM46329.1 DUF2834 domain-containing protein [Pacificispira spongiicola]